MGYRVYRLRPVERLQTRVRRSGWEIMNGHLSVRFDASSGAIEALVNRTDAVQMYGEMALPRLHEEGQYFLDYGVEHRAWYLGLTGREQPVEFVGMRLTEEHPDHVALAAVHRFGNSEVQQEYIVRTGIEHVEVRVTVDWHEIEHLLRLHFSVPLEGDPASACDSAYGVVEREPDGRETAMQSFCDLNDGSAGLALFNDGRYGAMIDGREMTLSAVRCSTLPDPRSDEGLVSFRYGIYPHLGDWREGDLVRRGYAFNRPLVAYPLDRASVDASTEGDLPAEWSFLEGSAEKVLPVVLKRAYGGEGWAMRLFNADNKPNTVRLALDDRIGTRRLANILEDPSPDGPTAEMRPFEVRTWLLDR